MLAESPSKLPRVLVEKYGIVPTSVDRLYSLSNEVYRVVSGSSFYILKKYSDFSRQKAIDLHRLYPRLSMVGVDIPPFIPNNEGGYLTEVDGVLYELAQFIPHRPLTYKEFNITQTDLALAARELVKIHSTDMTDLDLGAIDFVKIVDDVARLISIFENNYVEITSKTSESDVLEKLRFLKEYLASTEELRSRVAQDVKVNYSFPTAPRVLIHGDYSLTNLLPNDEQGKIYVIDWEGIRLAPRTYELQRSIGFLCGSGERNGYLDVYDEDRVRVFLTSYMEQAGVISEQEIMEMINLADYLSLIHWLRFTLTSINDGDFRILGILPESMDKALFLHNNLDNYEALLRDILV